MKKTAVVYIHGKGGSPDEAAHYKPLFDKCEVIGFDYKSTTPWEAEEEFSLFFDLLYKKYEAIILIANSIGAYFAMQALRERQIEKSFFISPIIDMEDLIIKMMTLANVSESDLRDKGEITTRFGETLSWEYLCYARDHRIKWTSPTEVLYGENDGIVSEALFSAFANQIGASLTVMKNGEHWFHTEEQMKFIDSWIKRSLR